MTKKLSNLKAPKKTLCVLVSGGLDSCILLDELSRSFSKISPLYIRIGLVWENTELNWLKRYLKKIENPVFSPLTVLSLRMEDVYGLHWGINGKNTPDAQTSDEAVYLPGRNIILLSKASIFCRLNHIETIAIGVLKRNPFPDGSLSFLQKFGEILSMGLDGPLSVKAPFAGFSKEEILRRGIHLPLELTFSCIAPVNGNHCGVCNKCAERMKVFASLNQKDQTVYVSKLTGKSHV